ncbi:MAG: nitroreductase family protein [Sphingomonas sp.]
MNRRQILIGGGSAAMGLAGAAWVGVRGMGSMAEYQASVAETRAALGTHPGLTELVRFATLAPNGHNTQPWRFRVRPDRIEILPDFSRRTPVVDPDDHHLFVSLGCATENLVLAAAASGKVAEATFAEQGGDRVEIRFMTGNAIADPIAGAIPHRQSTRADYDGVPLSTADLRTLEAAATVQGVDTVLLTARRDIDRVRDLVLAGNSAQMADQRFLHELKQWLRFNPRDALRTGDGLFSAASGSPALPAWAGPLLFDTFVTASSENDRYAQQLRSSSGVAVFVGTKADPENWVRVGQACQRFSLQATALGLKCAFINQPVEVAALRPDLSALVGARSRRPDIVMRFGRGAALPFSARRPTRAVIS